MELGCYLVELLGFKHCSFSLPFCHRIHSLNDDLNDDAEQACPRHLHLLDLRVLRDHRQHHESVAEVSDVSNPGARFIDSEYARPNLLKSSTTALSLGPPSLGGTLRTCNRVFVVVDVAGVDDILVPCLG